ncbi:MAG: hypothetical protein LUD81_08290 [Clostridiales bacterium]|nr:hypothetical protein [Clostridiales bacterium]
MLPKADFSENENRYLQEFPEFTAENIISGGFMDDIGTYVEDHFPLRDFFMELNGRFSVYVLGQKEVNGVYIGKDGGFYEKYEKPGRTEEIAQRFNDFSDKTEGRVYLTLVPTAAQIYSDKLPRFAEEPTQLETMEEYYSLTKTENTDVSEALYQNREEKLFYSLDHHWTTRGAYIAYREIAERMGFEPLGEDYFEITQVTDDFKGTVFSKVNMGTGKADTIEVYKSGTAFTVSYPDTEEVTDSFYNFDYLDKKDKYSLFLNNIHPLVEITNNSERAEGSLAIIKDSYANCLIPFLAEHFKTIYVFDTRYYRGSVSEFINENGIENTLILYNLNTIDTDLGIGAIY